MNPFGLIVAAAGLFSICGAAFDWDFFFNSYRARPFVWLFGRSGARIFYVLLGAAAMVLGAVIAIGVLPVGR